jgi:hypothetical protein
MKKQQEEEEEEKSLTDFEKQIRRALNWNPNEDKNKKAPD